MNKDINPHEIMLELREFKDKLAGLNGDIIKLGRLKSEAERNYRVLKAQKIVIFRADKMPVTLISDLVKGDPEVAELKMIFDGYDVMYDNRMQNIRSLRDSMSCLQSILNYLKAEISGMHKTDY